MAPATELTAAMNHVSYPCERNSNPPAFARFRQVACMPENRRRFFLDQALSSLAAPLAFCATNSPRKAAAHHETS